MKKLTIVFLYQNALRPESGGTERATKLVMDELERRGHKTIGLLHCTREQPDQFYLNNITIDSLTNFLHTNSVDIVINQIAYHHWLLEAFLYNGGKEWRQSGGKIISFMHLDPTPAPRKKISSYFRDWKEKSFIGKIKRLGLIPYLPILNCKIDLTYKHSLKYLYEHSDRYVLMSESFIDIFKKIANISNPDKIRCISNMLTFPKVEKPDIWSTKRRSVLVVARLDDEQKNISFIIDTWKSINNHNGYTLHLVGEGSDRKYLEQKAKDVPDIVFEGRQSPINWYKEARIFLMASPREGWGLTLTESLQCGVIPIVLNTSSVFADIILSGQNGFLAENKEEYIKYLDLLLHDETQLERMSNHALSSAYKFTPEKVGEQWLKMLSEL